MIAIFVCCFLTLKFCSFVSCDSNISSQAQALFFFFSAQASLSTQNNQLARCPNAALTLLLFVFCIPVIYWLIGMRWKKNPQALRCESCTHASFLTCAHVRLVIKWPPIHNLTPHTHTLNENTEMQRYEDLLNFVLMFSLNVHSHFHQVASCPPEFFFYARQPFFSMLICQGQHVNCQITLH